MNSGFSHHGESVERKLQKAIRSGKIKSDDSQQQLAEAPKLLKNSHPRVVA